MSDEEWMAAHARFDAVCREMHRRHIRRMVRTVVLWMLLLVLAVLLWQVLHG